MNLKALQLASRFSSAPNKLGYCGLDSAQKAFYACLVQGECRQVPEEIPHFKGLYPYLKTIAEVLNKDFLDYEVIEAYWLGNDSLKKFMPEHYEVLVENLVKQGLPDLFIEEVRNHKPKVFIPLHLFNVIHIGVGRITGAVPFNLESINNCMIRWGKVTAVNAEFGQVTVDLQSLQLDSVQEKVGEAPYSYNYRLTTKTETHSFMPVYLPNLKISDNVAVHWNSAVKVLDDSEVTNISHWSEALIGALN